MWSPFLIFVFFKDFSKYKSEIPHLVLVSGRKEQSVTKILKTLENNPIDPEQIALLNNIFKYNIRGHTGRGYTIIDTDKDHKTKTLAKGFQVYDGTIHPVWFLYSGMGSQWPAMGAELMRIPIFAETIDRCNKVLQSKCIDIIKIITDRDEEIFKNILNCFVGIAAVQIALTDLLKSIGITPDKIIGHSVGEIGCAYADGSLTLEEAIMFSYLRGLVSLETKLINGKMAAIGLGHTEVRKMCPPEIDIACHNSSESTTISGPADDVEKFVAYLTKQSIFAKTVASSGIAYHSRYIADAGSSLLLKMKVVVKNPKTRSKNWLSTSYTPDRWSEEMSKYASAEYFTNNLMSTVFFEETAKMIPNDAIVIEIAPHGLLQAIMKRSHKSCINLSLTRRGEKDSVKRLLQTIGELYEAGLNPEIDALYATIEFPVSTETPLLSHLTDWDHSVEWFQNTYCHETKMKTISYEFIISMYDDNYSFYQGSVRNGVNIFSEAAMLVVVWKTLAMYNGRKYTDTPVEFANVKFSNEVIIKPEEVLKLLVVIQKGTNLFEVTHDSKLVASGLVNIELNTTVVIENVQFVESDFHLNGKDIYEIMSTKGITYEDQSKSIKHINLDRNKGLIKWENNWVLFLDSLFLLNALSRNHNGVSNLKLITRLLIDVEAHKKGRKITYDTNTDICYGAQVFHDSAITKCSGVLLTSIAFNDIPKVTHNISKQMQIRRFTPHILHHNVGLQAALQINLQIISECVKSKFVMYYKNSDLFANIATVLKEIVRNIPSLVIATKSCRKFNLQYIEVKPDVLFLENFGVEKIDQNINEVVDIDKYIITINEEIAMNIPKQFREITNFKIGNQRMVLLKKSTATSESGGYYYIPAPFKSEPFSVKLVKGITNGSMKYVWAEHSSVPNNEVIQVVYSGVYIKDTGKSVKTKNNLNKNGIGFSGFDARGQRVMGVSSDGSVSSIVEPNHDFLWPVPKHWKLEEAATVPLPYIQAYYCLRIREQLCEGSNVYITHGDTAFGQAAISLCLNSKCAVFTTVSNVTKQKYLMKMFEELEETHIGYANDINFLSFVINATKKQRCRIVVNSDRGQARQDAMKFVDQLFGTFLDISDHDMEENNDYEMSYNDAWKTYKSVRLSNILLPEHFSDSKKLKLMLTEGIINGSVRPIPHVIYCLDEIPRAFQLLKSDNITGSVLINVYDTAVLKNDHNIMQRLELSPSKSYIVICDGTVLSVELIEYLIGRGAKQLLIHIKPKLMNGYFHVKYASWKKNDVVINFNSDDLHLKSACDALIAQAETLGGIGGIFITQNEFTKDTSTGKIDQETSDMYSITSNLDVASRNCTLDHFAISFLTLQEYNELAFAKIEKCCFTRKEIGLPSLILRYEANEKTTLAEAISKLCSALDASLKQNYTSVFLSDSKPNSTLYSDGKTSITDGLGAVFSYISEEEYIATEPVISMRTLVSHENENELHIDPDDDYVMMVPGLDGNFQTLRVVAERLKLPAITLQLEPHVNTSIPDIAKRILTIVKQRFHLKSKFYILGYSFGVNVALELAALLEKEGRTGVVFCLDSSPGAFKDQLIAYIGDMTCQQLQNSVIEHFYNLFTGKTFDELKEDVVQTLEWSEKINKLVEKVKRKVTYTHEFLKTLIDVVYKRIMMAKSYEPEFKLESELVLMRGIPHPELTKLSADYGLSKYSNKPVKVFDLEADHARAPQDISISNIINKMLDPELLNDYENKNLCQYYYA